MDAVHPWPLLPALCWMDPQVATHVTFALADGCYSLPCPAGFLFEDGLSPLFFWVPGSNQVLWLPSEAWLVEARC